MYQTIQAAAAAIRKRTATPVDLLDQCLEQIDKHEEKIKAWVLVAADEAREQAERLTAELEAGHYRGPLHGIPIGIKDIIDVFDWPTAAGSKLWANSIAREDATLIENLREAGAIILGKTVTTQYASFDPPPTRNPWNLLRTPGGSSSGSAAAVACGMCLGAVGTQTGGSITRPAAYCGVASCKPSIEYVSSHGVVPLAPSMDHPGSMGRSVWDVAAVLKGMTGYGGWDLLAAVFRPSEPKIGRLRGMFDELATPSIRDLMDETAEKLRYHGAVLEDVALPAAFSGVLARHRLVMAVEAAAFHEARFKRHPEDYRPNITQLLEEGLACPAPKYRRCLDHQAKLTQNIFDQDLFGKSDVFMTPATTSAAPDKATTGDPAFNSPWSYTGLPTVSIPVGFDEEGMPLSIQLVGRDRGERAVFAAAAWCEKTLGRQLSDPPS